MDQDEYLREIWKVAPLIAASMVKGLAYFMVGMVNSAPSLMPDGHRWVTVLTFV
jgi:hypothetical protein